MTGGSALPGNRRSSRLLEKAAQAHLGSPKELGIRMTDEDSEQAIELAVKGEGGQDAVEQRVDGCPITDLARVFVIIIRGQ